MSDLRLSLILKAVDRMTGPLRRVGRGFATTTKGMRDAARRTSQSMERMGKASRKLQDVGRNMALKVTAPLLGFGALTIRTAAKFEMGMNRVGVLTAATGDQLKHLEGQAKSLGATTQFSASQAADAMGFLAMAGFDAEKVMSSMPGTLQLAAAAQMDLAQAADIVSNVLTGYNMTADEIGRVNDVLVKSFTSANTDLSQLGIAMKYAGPVASGFGIQIEETAAAIGLMGNAGIQGSMAGTALRGALSKLANPAKDAKKALQHLGIKKSDLFDQEGQLKSFTNIIRKLGDAGAGADDMLLIFGDRAGPAMQALVTQGADALSNMTKQLEGAGGTAKRVADAQMNGATGEIRKMVSAFEGLQLAIADSGLLSWFTTIVEKLTGWISGLSKANGELLKWGTIIALTVAAIAPLVLAIGALGFAVKGIVIGAAVLKAGLLAMSGGFTSVIFAVRALGIALLTTPVGWIIAGITAIAGAAYLIYKNWEPIKAFFADLWGGIVGGFDDAVTRIRSAVKAMTGWLPDSMRGLFGLDTPGPAKPGARLAVGSAYAGTTSHTRNTVDVNLKIDSEGRPRLRDLKTSSKDVSMNVDAGMAMVGH